MNIKKLKTYQDWCDWSSEIYNEAGYKWNPETKTLESKNLNNYETLDCKR